LFKEVHLKATRLQKYKSDEQAIKFFEECFKYEKIFEIDPINEDFWDYRNAYQALLSRNADDKQKVIALSYWGMECGLIQL
jgi:hypothetical protein